MWVRSFPLKAITATVSAQGGISPKEIGHKKKMLYFAKMLNTTHSTVVKDGKTDGEWYSSSMVSMEPLSGGEETGTARLSVCTGTFPGEILGRRQRLNHYETIEVEIASVDLVPCTTGLLDHEGNKAPHDLPKEERYCLLIGVDKTVDEVQRMARAHSL